MSLSFKFLCCTFLVCGFVFPAQAESIDEHVNSYCEVVRKPGKKADAEFAAAIIRLAGERHAHLKPGMVNRYPDLVYLVLLNGAAWMMQETLDGLEKVSADKRVKLCRALETERLELMALSIEYDRMESYCESASQPAQQTDAKLLGENVELAIKNKVTIKPEVATRYPILIHQKLTAQSSQFCGNTQEILDKLEEIGMKKRARLCMILEKERLDMKRIDINYQSTTAMVEVTERK